MKRRVGSQGFTLGVAQLPLELTLQDDSGKVFGDSAAVLPSTCFGLLNVAQDKPHVCSVCAQMCTEMDHTSLFCLVSSGFPKEIGSGGRDRTYDQLINSRFQSAF
jgi:hypothetical protein